MTPDEYLRDVLVRHRVDMGPSSPVLQMRAAFMPLLQEWAGSNLLSVQPSGSFAKGTAVRTEAVKGHRATTHGDLKGLVVVVAASVAFGHWVARTSRQGQCRHQSAVAVERSHFPALRGLPDVALSCPCFGCDLQMRFRSRAVSWRNKLSTMP